jgi:hypothetical protein
MNFLLDLVSPSTYSLTKGETLRADSSRLFATYFRFIRVAQRLIALQQMGRSRDLIGHLWMLCAVLLTKHKIIGMNTYLSLLVLLDHPYRHTGFTPNKLMLGREVSIPADLVFRPPETIASSDHEDYVSRLQESIRTAHEVARDVLKTHQVHMKRDYDVKIHTREYAVGDIICVG